MASKRAKGAGAIVGVLAVLLGLVVVVPLLLTDDPTCPPGYSPTGSGDTLLAADDGARGIGTTAQAALAAGWRGDDAATAVAVAGAESSYNPKAANGDSTARGLWQIMLSLHQPKFAGADWRDPVANARVAHQLWRTSGWQPWVAYTSGAYRQFLPEARAAVQRAAGAEPTGRRVSAAGLAGSTAAAGAAGGAGKLPGLQPIAQAAADTVRSQLGFTGTIGGYADRNIAGTGSKSKHALGLAIDVMTSDRAVGDPIAAYFAGEGYEAFGVENVIWKARIYSRGRGWRPYQHPSGSNDPTLQHMDHVHIDFREGATAPGAAAIPAGAGGGDVSCVPAFSAAGTYGSVVYPVGAGAGADRRNFGASGGRWARGHTGTDFSVACGTPVVAAHAGTVAIDTNTGWSGRWLVKVSTGPEQLTSWYAHMQAVDVAAGQQVQAGQKLGEVGSEGNSTGCHLHFEVHPRNGTIYEDGIDPSKWLADNVGKGLAVGTVPALSSVPASGQGRPFVVAAFNILGHAHTEPGGNARGFARSPQRTPGLVQMLRQANVSVAGLQEVEPAQHRQLARQAPEYAIYHPRGDRANPVIFRKAEWELIGATHLTVPYFHGEARRIPLVQLRQRTTSAGPGGRIIHVVSVHNPANTRGPAQQWRTVSERRQLAAATNIARRGGQLLLLGDFNDKRESFCRLTRTGTVQSASGGSTGPRCTAPRWMGVDWIFGTTNIDFAGFAHTRNDRVSDHPLLATVVR